MLEAVELVFALAPGSRERDWWRRLGMQKLTSQQEFAIWQPAWPTEARKSQQRLVVAGGSEVEMEARERGRADVPFKLITSLMVAVGGEIGVWRGKGDGSGGGRGKGSYCTRGGLMNEVDRAW